MRHRRYVLPSRMAQGTWKVLGRRISRGSMKLKSRLLLAVFLVLQLSSVLLMLPTHKAHAAAAHRSNSFTTYASRTNTVLTAPAGIQNGDVLIIFFATGGATEAVDPTPPAGFTGLPNFPTDLTDTGFNVEFRAWYKVASGESGDYTVTHATSASQGYIVAVSGADTTNPINPNPTINNGIGTTATANSITTVADGSLVIWASHDWGDNANDLTAPTGTTPTFTERMDNLIMYVADGVMGTAGATGNKTMTIHNTSNVPWAASLVAVNAAPTFTLEQEGFRFRDDDGDEDSATWLASQDTDITRAAGLNTRLRTLVDAAGDPSSTQYQLEYKQSTDSTYAAVPVSLPAAGSVSYGAVGAYAASGGATSRNPALPTGITAQTELWAAVGSKNNATHSSASSNWTKVAQQNSGVSWTVSLWRYTGADATAAGSVTVTWTGSVASFGRSWSIQGRTGTDPLGTPSVNNGTTSPHTTTGVTTTSSGSRVMYVDASAANTAVAQPTSWTENFDSGSATGVTRLAVGGRDLGSSGSSSGNISITAAAAAWVQWQVELPAPQPAFIMSASSNIAASGENTTAQLTAPSGKTTSDFAAGRIQDDENPADAVDITIDDYTELEWNVQALSTVVAVSEVYNFRVTANGTPLDTYSTTPDWTIGSPNTAPDDPTTLVQRKIDDTSIATGGWTNETTVEFTASAIDDDTSSQDLRLCVEAKDTGTAFDGTESCGSPVTESGSSVTVTTSVTSLSEDQYHWRARIKDQDDAVSAWVVYDTSDINTRDFGVDTTAPTGGVVYDGTVTDTDKTFSDASLSALSANWSGFDFNLSGILKYEYSIGTTAGATDIRNWTDNTTAASVTATGLTLQTSQMYFVNIRATDNAGNTVIRSSNGQLVAPSMSFSVSPASITFDSLNAGNSYTDDTPQTTLTTSTNAYGGYVVRLASTDYPRSGSLTIPDFSGGSYASPAAWGSSTGFGYSTTDADIFPQAGSCPGGGTAPCYAPYSQTKPGDVVAEHTANVTGAPITADAVTIKHRVTVSPTQAASNYVAVLVYTVTALY